VKPMLSLLSRYARSKRKTLKYEFAIAAFAIWVAATVRLFLSSDPEWVIAQGVNYGTLTTTVWLYITAAVGIQAWQNTRPEDETAALGAPLPDFEAGDVVAEPTEEQRARLGQ
jgi:hypothetical protein